MTDVPALPPAPDVPAKPHPVDVALAAISEVAAELLASGRPSRFVELSRVATVALQVQRIRPAAVAGVEDMVVMGELDDLNFGPQGQVPVAFRIDLSEPSSFFAIQSFPIENRDILYVSNAPITEIQKFLNVLFSVAYPTLALKQVGF